MDKLITDLEAAEEGSRELDARMPAFYDKVSPEPNSGCWLWTAAVMPSRNGGTPRGLFSLRGKPILAHRFSYMAFNGDIPDGMLICHKCDNPICVNPAHLYAGTHADNMRDMKARRRSFGATQPERIREIGRALGKANTWMRGANNPRARLTDAQAIQIRNSNMPTKKLAEMFCVHRTTIQRIRRGQHWASLRAMKETSDG